MSSDEFHLFSTYSYLFGNKPVKSKLSISPVFLGGWTDLGKCWHWHASKALGTYSVHIPMTEYFIRSKHCCVLFNMR